VLILAGRKASRLFCCTDYAHALNERAAGELELSYGANPTTTKPIMIAESDYPIAHSLKGIKITPELKERFEAKINKDGPIQPHTPELGPCWIWTGCISTSGHRYGLMGYRYITNSTHRIAWVLENGDIPNKLHVLHKCDEPSCCRPSHLFLGTNRDNTLDRTRKGRTAKGIRHGSHTHPERRPIGETHGRTKLSSDDVREIRRMRKEGVAGTEIARRFGRSFSAIYMILAGKRRTSVPADGVPVSM
jgi:hypothetical protein